MALLDRKKLLQKQELRIEKVNLTQDDFVFVREMTARERDRFEQSLMTEDNKGDYVRSLDDFRAKLAVHTVCDENGNSILTPNDYPLLSKNMRAKDLEKIINKAQEMNRISESDKEELVKNSSDGQSEDSTLDSAEK